MRCVYRVSRCLEGIPGSWVSVGKGAFSIGWQFIVRMYSKLLRNDSGQVVHAVYLGSPSSMNWYRPLTENVTVGLASVVYPPMGSVAWEREMSTPPKLH